MFKKGERKGKNVGMPWVKIVSEVNPARVEIVSEVNSVRGKYCTLFENEKGVFKF